MSACITLMALCLACVAEGSKERETGMALHPSPVDPVAVQEDDPIHPALVAHRDAIEDVYEAGDLVRPVFGSWRHVAPSAASLLPDLRFAALEWDEEARAENVLAGIAHGLGETVAVETGAEDSAARVVARLSHSGNYESYGDLLAQRQVRVGDARDAEAVWLAFCELHGKSWARFPATQQSATLWHLGECTIRDFRYFYELHLDADGFVASGRLRAVRIESADATDAR